MEDLLHMPLFHTNQMGYIKVKALLPVIYGNVNQPRSQATPLDLVDLLPQIPGNWALTISYQSSKSCKNLRNSVYYLSH